MNRPESDAANFWDCRGDSPNVQNASCLCPDLAMEWEAESAATSNVSITDCAESECHIVTIRPAEGKSP